MGRTDEHAVGEFAGVDGAHARDAGGPASRCVHRVKRPVANRAARAHAHEGGAVGAEGEACRVAGGIGGPPHPLQRLGVEDVDTVLDRHRHERARRVGGHRRAPGPVTERGLMVRPVDGARQHRDGGRDRDDRSGGRRRVPGEVGERRSTGCVPRTERPREIGAQPDAAIEGGGDGGDRAGVLRGKRGPATERRAGPGEQAPVRAAAHEGAAVGRERQRRDGSGVSFEASSGGRPVDHVDQPHATEAVADGEQPACGIERDGRRVVGQGGPVGGLRQQRP